MSATSVPSFIRRLAARGVDVAIVAGIDVGLGRLFGFGFDWLAAAALIVLGYFVLLDRFLGATLGKLAFGLRVVGPDGGHPTLGQALIRETFTVLGAVPFVGPLLAIGAWIWIIVTIRADAEGRGKHDRLAGGTRVISVARDRSPSSNLRQYTSSSKSDA